MTQDLRHIRYANELETTSYTTLAELITALAAETDAVYEPLYTDAADAGEAGTLMTAVMQLTHEHRTHFYFVVGGAVQKLTLIFGFS